MTLQELQRNWDAFGRQDPFWAILTEPSKRGGKWVEEDFFNTGRQEVGSVMAYLNAIGLEVARERALDFGCGVGRLTQALCTYFQFCCGVDIAPSMIRLAQQYNRYRERCQYVLNGRDDLSVFEDASFDFIYSSAVLQHMRPEYAASYIAEFIRLLRPQGVLVFQLTSEPTDGRDLVERRARIDILEAPAALKLGARGVVRARVQNTGCATWIPDRRRGDYGKIQLGNHWCTETGEVVVLDDGRALLPHELSPGQAAELCLEVTAPETPGIYTLELDIVEEQVAWFKDHGSSTAMALVTVGGALTRLRQEPLPMRRPPVVIEGEPDASEPDAPVMEMYGVAKEIVIDLLERAGARVVDVIETGSAGPQWSCYRYCVTAPPKVAGSYPLRPRSSA